MKKILEEFDKDFPSEIGTVWSKRNFRNKLETALQTNRQQIEEELKDVIHEKSYQLGRKEALKEVEDKLPKERNRETNNSLGFDECLQNIKQIIKDLLVKK